ncbi:hypothetical protein V7149_00620 [Bacillus sp. JJ1503]
MMENNSNLQQLDVLCHDFAEILGATPSIINGVLNSDKIPDKHSPGSIRQKGRVVYVCTSGLFL